MKEKEMKRRSFLVVAAAAGIWSAAYAADDADAPVRWHGRDTVKIMRASMKPITLLVGDNAVDNPHTFICKSANGCVVTIMTSIQETNDSSTENETCSYVDGIPGAPGCVPNPAGSSRLLIITNQQQRVGLGSHVAQTIVNASNSGSQILGWNVEYTIYELHVRQN
jgi:hypothetical protein